MKKIILILFVFCQFTTLLYAQEKTQKDWYLHMLPEIKQHVPPMLTTKWGQNAPYNNSCPMVPNKNIHCKTGCVATAMAQVMKFYEYPTKGHGNISYQYVGDDKQKHTVNTDLSNSTYNWKKMKDNYAASNTATTEEKEAVATIMSDCGVAVSMQYGQYDSGAFDMDIAPALKEYFGYDSTVTYMSSMDEIPDSIWFCTLYQQLSEGMPVIYGGSTAAYLPHCFVIDGYNEEGKFHVVYGLGGGDGYVNIKEIAYRYGQSMTINIRPQKGHTGISPLPQSTETPKEIGRYLLNGTPITIPHKGINIVKMSNGTVKKVIIN